MSRSVESLTQAYLTGFGGTALVSLSAMCVLSSCPQRYRGRSLLKRTLRLPAASRVRTEGSRWQLVAPRVVFLSVPVGWTCGVTSWDHPAVFRAVHIYVLRPNKSIS